MEKYSPWSELRTNCTFPQNFLATSLLQSQSLRGSLPSPMKHGKGGNKASVRMPGGEYVSVGGSLVRSDEYVADETEESDDTASVASKGMCFINFITCCLIVKIRQALRVLVDVMAKILLSVLEVLSLIPVPVKTDPVSSTACHRCHVLRSCVFQALSRRDEPRRSLHASG